MVLQVKQLSPNNHRVWYLRTENKYWKMALADVIIRLVVAPMIFFSPWLASIITFSFDWADGEFFKRAGCPRKEYCIWDKALDYYWYFFILIYVFFIRIPGWEMFMILFIFRSFGQFAFVIFKVEFFLFLFPNLFEIFFFFYLFSNVFPGLKPFLLFPKAFYPLAIITILVLIREYILHVRKLNLSWFFTGKTTYWIDEEGS